MDMSLSSRLPMSESRETTDSEEKAFRDAANSGEVRQAELADGTVFAGRYRILSLIGSGGMGSVYKALDLTLNRHVALKMLHRELIPDEHALVRFQNEARATTRIKHAGVVAVYDFGLAEDQRPYLIMDYVEGISLASLIVSSQQLEPGRCAAIFSQVADTLAHTHKKRVFHRDLKPSNILVVHEAPDRESIRVVDFGIAKVLDETQSKEEQSLTQTGQLSGSPLYMSPEQCSNLPVDERSDIYSLGCVMYEALAGQPPFRGATAYDTILAKMNNPPAKIRMKSGNSRVAREMERIVLKAMAKEPEKRFQSMAELRDELNKVSALSSKAADRARFPYVRLAATMASLLVLACGACFLIWFKTAYSKDSKAVPLHIWQSSIGAPVVPIPANYLDVETVARGCLAGAKHSEGDRSRRVWQLTSRLADFHKRYGYYGQAAKEYEETMNILKHNPSDYTLPERSATERLIAECYFLEKKYDQALFWYKKAAQSGLYLFDQEAPYFIQIYANIADIYYSQGNLTEALNYLEKAIKFSKRYSRESLAVNSLSAALGKAPSVDHLVLLMSLADVLYGKQRYFEAIQYYDQALKLWTDRRRGRGGESGFTGAQGQVLPGPGKAMCEYNLGLAYEKLGDTGMARQYLKSGWADLIKNLPPDDPLVLQALSSYCEFLVKRDFPIGYLEAFKLKQQVKKTAT